ncbi:DNA topoisomerase 2 [Acanthamoeba polyphaga mimivirus]|uniref:DNA topoisomerase 2 n=4 Tax=Megamimivirinae TaxID=3044648 RepID=A0A2L2DIZ8_MIMIV|nr:DNA topoisomerase II [Megavirus chiliensis]AEQ32844.1 DNA topoisomerase 2 [Megavirus chiliensis]AVG46134.1 DNA topoisomerase 2 [Acanthamoeba polyphaga mimivirus]AVG47239.1 DNA topoisomerase 2 [Acanthamoeba polyphaga mimivirus]
MSKTSKKSSEKTIEEKYQKKNLHEHILHSPDTYIGSIEDKTCNMWIYNNKFKEGDAQIIFKEISYVPGLYKIYDEVLVNSADHSKRCKSCNMIKVDINEESGEISVWNNGDGIDVVEHKEHKIMVPSMIFGELLTSTNYDKGEKKIVGGKNGFGAKLANIYSTEFHIETIDAKRGKKFYQKFTDNMYTKEKPKITTTKSKTPYTKISFIPDFKKFGLKGLTNDIVALFKKRVYDLAMTTNAKVYFNEKIISQNNFTKYIDLYFPEGSEHKKVLDVTTHDRWKVCAVYDPTDQLEHQNISFVNSICTSRGGTHVDQVVNQVVKDLKEAVAKKVKGLQVKPTMIKENLIFFVDATIVNPDFDTQTKEYLTTKPANFGSNFTVTDIFIKKVIKTGVVSQIIANAQAKAEASLSKTDGKGRGAIRYEKLYNAHKAGTKEGYKCTLILTEGDSAKTFAMSGLNVIGRDYYGVFPLKGKPLNVRTKSPLKIAENEEITAIKKIIGLEQGKVYNDLKELRYGSIMILADQDVDGYHIKGLIMNLIHRFWPSLAKYEGFIQSFATPLLKATKGKGKTRKVVEFTNPQSFEEWKQKNNDGKGWTIKYYKGLGTSTQAEAQECFTDLDKKRIKYFWESKRVNNIEEDEEESKPKPKVKSEFIDEESDVISEIYKPKNKDICEDAITLAFDKKRENDRKIWVNTYNPNNYIDNAQKRVSYYDFIHQELISFSVDDNLRSIPNIMDGFKPSQRKVFYGSVEEGIYKEEIKVSELQGAVSKRTKYHHGEQSLTSTIVNMAQNYVGSNNINLLMPNGQFGTRMSGGKDSASARYIFTQLDELAKKIFIEHDFDILHLQYEDNKMIEPQYYAPVIPMILVNGTEGIGTGYSTKIAPCNPRDIYDNILRILNDEKTKTMKPWYRHFTGTIEKIDNNKYVSRAKYEIIGNDTIHITDLPIGTWTDNYKAFLDNLIDQGASQRAVDKKAAKEKESVKPGVKGKAGSKTNSRTRNSKTNKYLAKKSQKSATAKVAKKNPISSAIKTYTEDCTQIRISFTINFHPGKLSELIKTGKLDDGLKLVSPIQLTNMHLFNEYGKIKKYDSYGEILRNFSKVRLDLYQKRKDHLLGKWRKEMDILKWKVKFIMYVIEGKIIIFKNGKSKKKDEIMQKLEELEFPKFITGTEKNASYNYITSTGLFNLTHEEVERLKQQLADKKEEVAILESKTPKDIWIEELEEFMEAYDKWESETDAHYDGLLYKNVKTAKKKITKASVSK